ncbi:winged helix DNA-binding domain-containing protein [Nocardioides sp.]|uniref:winged helix DNA-binding domain-containing protein n=1 Tax=Nocardioides sp. TaxID=35761 RepID=UPI002D7E28F3|nr:winged helix DNA-binding domain-containing protein [Nocardioides sp.]HET8960527.1 winged helix DNA-binding domain-containing protein [Nocardioides sp.]
MRHIGDDERRARIARRHALAPNARVADPLSAARALTVLHATEPATVYLSLFARVAGLTVADVDRALYDDRSLVKQLAMRRTLFAFPRDLLPAAWGSASARVAEQERRRTAKDAERGGLALDGEAWLKEAREAVLDRLADGSALSAATIRAEVPALAGKVRIGSGKWSAEVSLAPRVLGLLGAEALVVRGRNDGHWRVSRPAWTLMAGWLGEQPAALEPHAGYAELVRRWLRTFGPGTETDIVWWLGATRTAVRRALVDVGAVEVSLDHGGTGWVLADDLEPVDPEPPWAALLPALDPTTMGWKERDFYLPPDHVPYLFDTNGNAGSTAWWNGRIVGCWVQAEDGAVRVALREDPGARARAALDVEAERLTAFLGGVRVNTVYASQQMRAALRS